MYEGFHFNNGLPLSNVVTLKSITEGRCVYKRIVYTVQF